MKSEAIRLVSELVERANNQADTIDSQKENLIKLNKQLEDKYSTETHLLVSRETLGEFIEKFDDLSYDIEDLARQLAEEYFDSKDFKVTFDYASSSAFRAF